MAYKNPVSVLVVIHTADGQFLLLERAAHPGYWQSVTGSLEDGETLWQTALREVQEETGLDARRYTLSDWQHSQTWEIYPQWRHRYAPGVTENTEHSFSLCLPQVEPIRLAPREHRDYRWLPQAEAAARCFSPSNRDAILKLRFPAP